MIKPHFIFKSYSNFFKVYVDNLEQLSVVQIKEILDFVQKRRGFFDFDTYTFKIQKKMDFEEFCTLCNDANLVIDLQNCQFNNQIDLEEKKDVDVKIDFGKHKGCFFKDLPDSYIIWLRKNYLGKFKDTIVQEYEKRALSVT